VWRATAICGNDISSSVLYVSALCAAQAGALAPVALLAVAGVLYLFRKVYGEVGSALPLNGGTYTLLLNTTGKRFAAAAACLTLLSYVATAVISANEAMHYAANLFPSLPIIPATLALLGGFALLNVIGISESATVALGIFALHLAAMTVLSVAATFAVLSDPALFWINWHAPPTNPIAPALFLGFAAAMLGVSGFESSANFIEEQEPGVFPKTLRNMWLTVLIFNPLISLLSLGLLPLADIEKVPHDLMARMSLVSAGPALRIGVCIDAVLVLSGAVLTSYVGVTGLVRRMSLDQCLPQVLLRTNRWRGTNHWIIVAFFALCASILVATGGRIGMLAGVYALSFLSVMVLYAAGNLLLKRTRARLPRTERAGVVTVAVALAAAVIALLGNVVLDPLNVGIFAVYFAAALLAVGVMFQRVQLLRFVLSVSRTVVERVQQVNAHVRERVIAQIQEINARAVVYFSRGDDLEILNRAALYVLRNEQTANLKVVHVYESESEIPSGLASMLATVDKMYPQLRIDFLAVKGEFGPELIERLSNRLHVPKNAMFIGTPSDRFPHNLADLGGVRVIL
jgi:amino acid transporter